MAAEGYIVVFRCTVTDSPYRGVITWTSFPDKAGLAEALKLPEYNGTEVVEEGVTAERAVELSKETPVECHFNVAVAKAVNPDTGVVDLNRLGNTMEIAMWAVSKSHKKSALRLPQ